MAGADFELDISELENLAAAFHKASAMDISKLLDEIGVEEESQIKERFETKEDPEGSSWPDWSDDYRKRVTEKSPGASILMGRESRLQESVSFEITNKGIAWGSPMIYARVHQDGWEDKNIPARAYLGIGEEDEFLLTETIEDFVRREAGGLF